jgi:peroxiredoxin
VMLVFYPGDFSPVCGDQLSIYQEVKPEIAEKGVELIGISVDSFFAHKAFQEKLGIDTTLLSDFEPKGEVARAYGSYVEKMGFANRTLVLIDEDGVVAWTYESPNPGEFPGANVIFDALS